MFQVFARGIISVSLQFCWEGTYITDGLLRGSDLADFGRVGRGVNLVLVLVVGCPVQPLSQETTFCI